MSMLVPGAGTRRHSSARLSTQWSSTTQLSAVRAPRRCPLAHVRRLRLSTRTTQLLHRGAACERMPMKPPEPEHATTHASASEHCQPACLLACLPGEPFRKALICMQEHERTHKQALAASFVHQSSYACGESQSAIAEVPCAGASIDMHEQANKSRVREVEWVQVWLAKSTSMDMHEQAKNSRVREVEWVQVWLVQEHVNEYARASRQEWGKRSRMGFCVACTRACQ